MQILKAVFLDLYNSSHHTHSINVKIVDALRTNEVQFDDMMK